MADFRQRREEDIKYIESMYKYSLKTNRGIIFDDSFIKKSYKSSVYKMFLDDIESHKDLEIHYILIKRIELLSRARIWDMNYARTILEDLYLQLYGGPS